MTHCSKESFNSISMKFTCPSYCLYCLIAGASNTSQTFCLIHFQRTVGYYLIRYFPSAAGIQSLNTSRIVCLLTPTWHFYQIIVRFSGPSRAHRPLSRRTTHSSLQIQDNYLRIDICKIISIKRAAKVLLFCKKRNAHDKYLSFAYFAYIFSCNLMIPI